MRTLMFAALLGAMAGCDDSEFRTGSSGGGGEVTADHDGVIALMASHCEECHTDGGIWQDFTLELLEDDIRNGTNLWVVPGDAAASEMWIRISGGGERAPLMPTTGALPEDEVAPIQTWIDEGAILNDAGGE